MQYRLEIYHPGSADDLCANYHSESPFVTVSPGDLISPGDWGKQEGQCLRVVAVQHVFSSEHDPATCTTNIYTEAVELSRELVLGKVP